MYRGLLSSEPLLGGNKARDRSYKGSIHPCHTAAILSGGPKKLCFTALSLIPMVSIARLSVVKQSSFDLPGQYDRLVTRTNSL